MNRQPQYTKDNMYRMISVANGFWRVQRYENYKGTNTSDPWSMVGQPTDYVEALAVLRSHEPARKAA